MQVKLLEIRDRGTTIQAFAMKMQSAKLEQHALLAMAGFGASSDWVLFGSVRGGKTSYDAYSWGDRTWATSHQFVTEHFDELKDGDVIDVEFILGESAVKKTAEWLF